MSPMLRGRPTIGKRAMTPAERQRKSRRLKRKAAREQEMMDKRAANEAKLRERQANPPQWVSVDLPGRAPMETPADEIAYQIEEMLVDYPDVTIEDVRDAIDRRWPPEDR